MEVFFRLADLAVQFFDALAEFLQFLEESSGIFSGLLQLRNFSGSGVLSVLQLLHFRQQFSSLGVVLPHVFQAEIAFAASFYIFFHFVEVLSDSFNV